MQALILELVEGETLADRIAAGPIPLDEALPIARQVTDALEAAHERGVIHRDLKPANIKLTSGGKVKVLDFGLAKLTEPAAASSGAALLSQSPTITTPAMTRVGVILGTAAYMSPEQAKGRPADKRADIWAVRLGSVSDDDRQAGVLRRISLRRACCGSPCRTGLERASGIHADCDSSAADALFGKGSEASIAGHRRGEDEIDDAATPEPAADAPPGDRRLARAWIAAGLMGAALTVVVLGVLVWNLRSPRGTAPAVARFSVVLDDAYRLILSFGMMAFVARTLKSGEQKIRHGVVERLTFPSGPYEFPRLSPDGARIAVSTDTGDEADIWIGDLKAGGSLRRLTFGGRNRFPAWSADGGRVTYKSDRDGDRGIFCKRLTAQVQPSA